MLSYRYLFGVMLLAGCYSTGGSGEEGSAGGGGSTSRAGATSKGGSTSKGGDTSAGGETGNEGGAGGSPDLPAVTFLECPIDVMFHLTGEVDGQAIDINEAPTLGGFHQSDAPPYSMFRLPNETDSVPDLVNIELTWDHVIANGETTAIAGWVLMPPGAPLAGETICAGPGSQMTIPLSAEQDARGEFLFALRELSLGTACDQPVSGQLDACWRN